MAIARLLKTEIVCMAGDDARLLTELERERIIHIDDVHDGLPAEYAEIESAPIIDATAAEAGLQKAKTILDAFSKYSPVKKGLLDNFFGSPPYVEEDAFRDIAASVDIEEYETRVMKITSEIDAVSKSLEKLEELRSTVDNWSFLDYRFSELYELKHVAPIPLDCAPGQAATIVDSLSEFISAGDAVWAELHVEEKRVCGIVFAVPAIAAEISQRVKSLGIEPVSLPDLDENPRQALERIAHEMDNLQSRKAELESLILKHADEGRRHVQAVSDERANARGKFLVRKKLFYTRNVLAVQGWILERNRGRLESMLRDKFPESEVRFTAPSRGDNPPVKLENPRILRPFQSLLEMFGLPTYFGIDSTWFVAMAMSLFYAICLGDTGYGICQILITWWLIRKFKPAEGTRLFLKMFMEMGFCTVIFGILTWSFFGFSPGYEVGGPKILGILPLLSPTTDILPMIGIAAAIGTVFQLGSILISFYASLKNGDLAGAYYDRLAWFAFLLGLILVVGTKAFPGNWIAFAAAGWPLFGAGGLTILLFAGRDSKSIVGRLFTGIISFYGILGYYGAVSFFGDVLSYLRLAILNLTGGFISFVANILGDIIRGEGNFILVILTFIISLLPMLLFHVLNLVLSMMGSFVHSLRLNYLESFSRYYGSGGKVFAPFKKEGRYYRFEQ